MAERRRRQDAPGTVSGDGGEREDVRRGRHPVGAEVEESGAARNKGSGEGPAAREEERQAVGLGREK